MNKDLTLSDRVWECSSCGAVLDRDLNAARNLRDQSIMAGSSLVVARGDGIRPQRDEAVVSEVRMSSSELVLTNQNEK